MKKWLLGLGAGILVIGGVIAGIIIGRQTQSDEEMPVTVSQEFRLSEEFYKQGELVEIDAEELAKLVVERKSFLVVAKMTICPAEFPITSIAKQLAREKDWTIFALSETEFKQTTLAEKVKYLPSAAIYHDGELVNFLDAESDEDLRYYQSVDGLLEWLEKNGVKV